MRINGNPPRIKTYRDIPEATIRDLVARGLSDQGMARELNISATVILKARRLYGIKTRCMDTSRTISNRLSDQPPPVSDAEHARWLRSQVWGHHGVPREANC